MDYSNDFHMQILNQMVWGWHVVRSKLYANLHLTWWFFLSGMPFPKKTQVRDLFAPLDWQTGSTWTTQNSELFRISCWDMLMVSEHCSLGVSSGAHACPKLKSGNCEETRRQTTMSQSPCPPPSKKNLNNKHPAGILKHKLELNSWFRKLQYFEFY